MASRPSMLTKWVFTLNNPTEQDKQDVLSLSYQYLVFQLERGDSGTPHYQGMVVLDKKQRLSTLKKSLPRAHFEGMRGTVEQAAHYASKPHEGCSCDHCQKAKKEDRLEGPYYHGVYRDSGTRSDLMSLQKDIKSGMPLEDLADTHFSLYIRYGRGINEYRRLHSTPRTWKTEVWFLFGPTNSGKTWIVHQMARNLFVKPHGTWWTGFDSHTDVLLDEFTSTKYGKITDLNQWFDQYPCTAPVHGGTVNFNPRRVWITSNIRPADLFPKVAEKAPELVKAFWNRVEYIVEFHEDRTFELVPEMYIGSWPMWKEGDKRL